MQKKNSSDDSTVSSYVALNSVSLYKPQDNIEDYLDNLEDIWDCPDVRFQYFGVNGYYKEMGPIADASE